MQAEEWAARERIEAAAIQQLYDSTYVLAEDQFEGPRALLQDIQVRLQVLQTCSRCSAQHLSASLSTGCTRSQAGAADTPGWSAKRSH